jgi:hypothetical protein
MTDMQNKLISVRLSPVSFFGKHLLPSRIPTELLFYEDFSGGIGNYDRYGYPYPVITGFYGSENGYTLDNNGDGSYHSLARSKAVIANDSENFYFEMRVIQKGGNVWDYMYVGLGSRVTSDGSYPDWKYRAGIMGYRPNAHSELSWKLYLGPVTLYNYQNWNIYGFENEIVGDGRKIIRMYMNNELIHEFAEEDVLNKDLYFIDTGRSSRDTGRVDWYRVYSKKPEEGEFE